MSIAAKCDCGKHPYFCGNDCPKMQSAQEPEGEKEESVAMKLLNCLRELVRLKEIKERVESEDPSEANLQAHKEYLLLKPAAWSAAKRLVHQYKYFGVRAYSQPTLPLKEQGSAPAEKGEINEDEWIDDIKKQWTRPNLHEQQKISVSVSEACGNVALAFWRGVQAGEAKSPSKPAESKKEQEGEVNGLDSFIKEHFYTKGQSGEDGEYLTVEQIMKEYHAQSQTREAEDIEALKGTLKLYKGIIVETEVEVERLRKLIKDIFWGDENLGIPSPENWVQFMTKHKLRN